MDDSELQQTDDYRALFLNDVPLLDVRAPVEFAEGAFPTARNHPLMNDIERHEVGIAYKEQGQDSAVELGERLVSGKLKTQRIAQWRSFLARHPDAILYCFRGGMRSKISQRWLQEEAGINCPRVHGGYKAMRRFLLDQLTENSTNCQPVVIGGRTGVGKTRLLAACQRMIDLEALANHRGSAFGHHPSPQPTQIDFENALSIQLMKRVADSNAAFAVEDESRNVGSRHVPPVFFARLETAPLVLLEASMDERIAITLDEYVNEALAEHQNAFGEDEGFRAWAEYLLNSIDRIRRRLGGDRHVEVRGLLENALAKQSSSGDVAAHRDWIAQLLGGYYDGMYQYQLEKKAERIVFRGERAEVADFLHDRYGIVQSADCVAGN
jgi:tRNA 2-selenouridine synthase